MQLNQKQLLRKCKAEVVAVITIVLKRKLLPANLPTQEIRNIYIQLAYYAFLENHSYELQTL